MDFSQLLSERNEIEHIEKSLPIVFVSEFLGSDEIHANNETAKYNVELPCQNKKRSYKPRWKESSRVFLRKVSLKIKQNPRLLFLAVFAYQGFKYGKPNFYYYIFLDRIKLAVD